MYNKKLYFQSIKNTHIPTRRNFIRSSLQAGIVISVSPAMAMNITHMQQKVRVGVITDLHQDIMHDGPLRLQSFLDHMKKQQPDALLQLGDFAYPGDKNKNLIDQFNRAHPLCMHVIGNHDTDDGYTKEQCIQYWGMPSRYYTQMVGGICFIVLDANDKGSTSFKGGYPSYISEEQFNWLQQKLESALESIKTPIVIVSHQPLAGTMAVDNAVAIQQLLSKHSDKILLAINGHSHINAALEIGGVHYVHINSASYYWVGGKYKHDSYAKDIIQDHEWIAYTCPYKDALFATLTIDPSTLTVSIEGINSTWVGKSPEELQVEAPSSPSSLDSNAEIAPRISNRSFLR